MKIFEHILTPVFVFILGYLLTRIAGKKSVSQMDSYVLIFIMIIGTSISEPIVTHNNWLAAWYSLAVTLLYILLSRLVLVNRFKKILTPSPTVLIRGGDIDEYGLRHVKMTVEELLGELRVKGYTNPTVIDIALMEESGEISVIPKASSRPLQPNDIKITPEPVFISIPIIIDGEIIMHNLKFINKDKKWLFEQLLTFNISEENIKTVILATVNQQGKLEVDNNDTHDHQKGFKNYKPGDEN